MELDRRTMLAGAAAAAAATAWHPLAAQNRPPLTSDIGTLRRVLVHSFKAADHQVDLRGGDVLP